jgi:hypothetical protein
MQSSQWCGVWSSHSRDTEVASLLGCDTVPLGEGWCELEAWSLTLTEENRQMISENRMLRGIFDLTGWKW